VRHIVACLNFLLIGNAAAATIADLSNAEAVRGLKQALNDGSAAAVARLGVENGYYANPNVKIPLPPSLQRVERGLRAFGMRRQADELVVKQATDRVGLAQQYNALAGQGVALGLVKEDQASIESYVTQKALDGLYFMIGEQEKAFRQDPVGATSDIVRKVFGALR